MDTKDMHMRQSVVVLGAKPDPALPLIEVSVVVTANGAVEYAVPYRQRFNSRIVALASSGDLRDRPDMQQSLSKSRPDEIILLGEHIENPVGYVRNTLGLPDTRVSVLSFRELRHLTDEMLGWRRFLIAGLLLKSRGIKYFIKYVLPDWFGARWTVWLSRSTGLNAILYTLKRFSDAEVITAGIGLQPGTHLGGGIFAEKTAKVDQMVMKHWPSEKKTRVYTTDETMSKVGNVKKWEGETFGFSG